MIKSISDELKKEIGDLIGAGETPPKVKAFIMDKTGFKKTKANDIYNEVLASYDFQSEIFDFELVDDEKEEPFFNKELKKYVVYIPCLGRNIVISEDKHNTILQAYSNWDGEGKSLNEICRALSWPRQVLTAYIKAFSITHDSLPISDSDLQKYDNSELTERLHELRKFAIFQKFEKEDWVETQKLAQKWREFYHKKVSPFEEILNKWTPPVITKLEVPKESYGSKTLLIGLSDLHWGSAANEKYMYHGKGGWTTEKTTEVVKNYCAAILKSISDRKYGFDKVIVCFLGDFLHSISGKTGRGTELKYDCIREEQFDHAMNSLVEFIGQLAGNFAKVEVHSVGGNHAYEAELGLYRAIMMAYKNQESVKFFNYASRPASFLVDSTLIMLDHGADSVERTYVPTKEASLRSHVNSLLVKKPELLKKSKSRLFLTGDKHTWKNIEFDNFEYIMFGTSLGADQHADTNNWNNRARQSCLVLDETGLKEILHFYTDELL